MEKELIKFITESSLYSSYEFINPDLKQLLAICDRSIKFEMFCPSCESMKVFTYDDGMNEVKRANLRNRLSSVGSVNTPTFTEYEPLKDLDHLYLRFKCSLDDSHKLEYFFAVKGNALVKIGQFPSSADQDLPQAVKYRSILGKQYYDELKRAIGLYSHGVGIGSFVYLRRIIEKLVHDAFEEAKAKGAITKEQFEFQDSDCKHKTGMEEKIKRLKGFLPDLMTEQPKIYGIVSKGIHELSEDECRRYFPVLKDGIIMILDSIVATKEKEKAEAEYKKSLGKILAEVK